MIQMFPNWLGCGLMEGGEGRITAFENRAGIFKGQIAIG